MIQILFSSDYLIGPLPFMGIKLPNLYLEVARLIGIPELLVDEYLEDVLPGQLDVGIGPGHDQEPELTAYTGRSKIP